MADVGIYGIATLGTAANQITFNDFDYQYQTGVLYRMKKRAPSNREIREFNIPIPEQSGIADFQTFVGRSFFIIEGTMYPDDEIFYDQGRDLLRKVSSLDIQQSDTASDEGYVPYSHELADGSTRIVYVKVEYVDIPEATSQGIVQPFRILCKVKRPFEYAPPQSGVIGATSEPTITGNSALPFTLPRALGASIYEYNGTFQNYGNLHSYPSFTITGPCTSPRITYTTTGEYIQLDTTLTADDTVSVVYDEDTTSITLNGNSIYNKLSSASTLFTLRPGAVDLKFTAASKSDGAHATVSFSPAWPIS